MFKCQYSEQGCAKTKEKCTDPRFAKECPYAKYFKYLKDNFKS